MPIDKQPKGPPNKPITPALSSRFRTTKTPVALKLASSSPATSATTVRKDQGQQVLSPPAEQTQAQPLNGNVTPRSGARNTRISTDSPASPATRRRLSGTGSVQGIISPTQRFSAFAASSNNTPGFSRLGTKASSPTLSTTRRTSGSSNISKKDDETTKFIRADDAKPVSVGQTHKSTSSPRPLTTSFLKNGSPRTANSAPPSALNARVNLRDENFVRATEANVRASRPPTITRKQSTTSIISTGSAKNRSPGFTRTQTQTQIQIQQEATSQRPSLKTRPTTVPANQPVSPSKHQSPSPTVASPRSSSNRRQSFGSKAPGSAPTRPVLHRKSASVSSFGPLTKMFTGISSPTNNQRPEPIWVSPTVTIPFPRPNLAIPSPDTLSPRSASLASSKTMGTSVTSDTDMSEISKSGLSYSGLALADAAMQSSHTTQPQPTPLARAQADAANARRERKVLDLEISNSSLLAINKTLEKELRKQSAELRRFRRLSRCGRLSFAPSNRSVSGQSAMSLDTLQEQSENDSDRSEEDDEESDVDTIEDEDNDDPDDSLDRTTARARRRARDERRLMLDLSKHQQLLVDSQRMTTSIKRCISISDDLIKEANQALKYKVGIGDIQLGGRVLTSEDMGIENSHEDDHPEEDVNRKGLLSPSLTQTELQEAVSFLTGNQLQHEALNDYIFGPSDPG